MNRLRALGAGLWAAAALVVLAFGPQCGGGGAPRAASGSDAGGEPAPQGDAIADTLVEAQLLADAPPGADARRDTGAAPDTGSTSDDGSTYTGDACPPPLDAGIISDWSGFRRLTELDPCCPFDVALDAAQAAPAVQWIPCQNGAPGCLEMKAGWNPLGPFGGADVSVADDGTPQYLHIGRRLSDLNNTSEDDIYSFPGYAALGAWRPAFGPASCSTGTASAGTQATLVAFINTGGAPAGTYVASADPASLASTPHFARVGDNLALYSPQDLHSSETTLGFDIGPSAAVGRAALDGGTNYVTAVVPGQVSVSFVSRGDVFAYSLYGTTGWEQLYVMQPNNSVVLFRSNPSAHVGALATDGPNLYWTETYGSIDFSAPQQHTQVWTAPYTDDPTQLGATARQIADIQNTYLSGQAIAFGGLYAFWPGTNPVVVRASDGAIAQVPMPGDYQYWEFSYVTDTELWAVMTQQHGPNGVAFARVTLGPWSGGD